LVNALDKLQILCPEGETISPELVAKNIGISKDFNEFELHKALGARNDRKALMIANYFASNQKDHHLIKVIVSLYYFYSKVIKYHSAPNHADNQTLARTIGISPYFLDQYRMAAKNYPMVSLERAIKVLYDMDLKSKGVGNASTKSPELMIEMVSKLLRV
jgi:DNA polymerase-3 subunit delta